MSYYVYMLKSINRIKSKTYVGYTSNLKDRLKKHNTNRGAKSTKGHNWIIIYKKKFLKKNTALSYEYKLKNDRKKRKLILNDFNKTKN